MIALSFLGLGKFDKNTNSYNYDLTKYKFNDQIIKTDLFPYAVSQFIKPDKLFIIMTDKAKEQHYDKLKKLCDFEEILIPNGKTEDEFWITFDKITSVINQSDEVVFDITHGFRSQPFIVIVLLLYLKTLKNIKINNIIYGAFEAKDDNGISPVFELRSFVDLIEWSNAVREFTENGNMKHFKTLLAEIHKNTYLNKMKNPSKQLLGVGKDLEALTDGFDTIRLNEILETTSNFNLRLKDVLNDLENHIQAKPFKSLFETIVNKFLPISNAEKEIFSEKGFEAQKAIINWYIETHKYQKAITLAREYVVSKFMIEIDNIHNTKLIDHDSRLNSENILGELVQKLKKDNGSISKRQSEYANLWAKIVDIRNDINHAGMNKDPKSSRCIIEQVTKITKTINEEF